MNEDDTKILGYNIETVKQLNKEQFEIFIKQIVNFEQ